MERKDHINFWYAIGALVAVLLIQNYWFQTQHTETIPYSRFEELLKGGAVKDIAIGRDKITGTLKEPGKDQKPHFEVVRIDPGFAETLSRYGVEFKYTAAPTMTKSLHSAISDLALDAAWIVYPGRESYPVHERVSVVPLPDAMQAIDALVQRTPQSRRKR